MTVFSITDPDLPGEDDSDGVHFERFDRQEFLSRVCDRLQREPFDVVQVYNRPGWVPAVRRAAREAAVVLSLHNLTHKMVDQHVAVSGFQQADHVLAISDFVADDAVAKLPQLSGKVQTVYTGVDLGEYAARWSERGREWRASVRSRHGLPSDQPVVLFVGRLIETKGCHVLLRAMRDVLTTHPEVTLLVVGGKWYADDSSSGYVQELQRLAQACDGRVVFTSYVPVDEIPQYYAAADLFVCASQWNEPLGRVHYEAMAAGLPIVTTNRGGIREVVQDGENGIVLDRYADPDAFASAILTLLDDPGRADAMGRAGRRKAEEVYNFERMASELQAAYCALLEKKRRTPEGAAALRSEEVPAAGDGRVSLRTRSRLFARRARRGLSRLIRR